MARFIGMGEGFAQRHYDDTTSPYCHKLAINRTKGLVRSKVTLNAVRKDVLNFGAYSNPPRPKDPVFDRVVKEAAAAFRLKSRVHPIHLNDLPKMHLATDASSPGLPWRELGYRTKREVMDDGEAFNSIRTFWHRVKYGNREVRPPDCAAYLRAHIVQEGETKVRAVWGYPATVGFQEACFALPLIEAYKKGGYPFAYGYETALGGHLRINSKFGKFNHFLNSDYKCFDKTIPAWLIRIAFDILFINLDLTQYAEQGVPKTEALLRAWNYIVEYFIRTPIKLSNGERYRKFAGVASGSYFTQLIDTIVNWIVTTYALYKCGRKVLAIMLLGDDGLVALDDALDLEEFAFFVGLCGMIINLVKTVYATSLWNVKFLGYYIRNGVPYKPEEEFWASLKFPEHPDRSFDEYATRAMGLLLATFGQHQLFYDAIYSQLTATSFEFVMKPSLRRYLEALGIKSLPPKPPDIVTLSFAAFY